MEIVYDDEMLTSYINEAVEIWPGRPILIDRFLENAIECEADRHCRRRRCRWCPSVMEHIELAGIHSRRQRLRHSTRDHTEKNTFDTINEITKKIAVELNVVGLMTYNMP